MQEKKIGNIIINHPRRRIDRQVTHLRPCHLRAIFWVVLILVVVLQLQLQGRSRSTWLGVVLVLLLLLPVASRKYRVPFASRRSVAGSWRIQNLRRNSVRPT